MSPPQRLAERRVGAMLSLVALLLMGGCELLTVKPPAPAEPPAGPAAPELPAAVTPPAVPPPPADPEALTAAYRPASWSELPGWGAGDAAAAWTAFIAGCASSRTAATLRRTCAIAANIRQPSREEARRFFETSFTPHRVVNEDRTDVGLITGYYEPLLRGSRRQSARYRYPVFGVPDDLLVIDLGELQSGLKNLRLRGRVEGRRVVPYYDRADIDRGHGALAGREIAWVDDPIELFFLQVQGSGRIALDSHETIRVGFADHNGHPYRSIGRVLIERGELQPEQASMQGIKDWARANPSRLTSLLNENARYVFFRELPAGGAGPPGAMGVPLTPRRSIAVDPRFIPLGAPVFIATTWPLSARPLTALVLAQDTGGAIRGAVRADYFWGYGETAAREAGRMKQALRMWVLLPKDSGNPQAKSRPP